MTRRGRPFRAAWASALIAVALLSFASIKSVVMQAADASPFASAHCMAGMAMGVAGAGKQSPAKTAASACVFCSVAAHAALITVAEPVACPVSVIWRPKPLAYANGVRGPPEHVPSARGPPTFPEIV
jgi:hypothetical protein